MDGPSGEAVVGSGDPVVSASSVRKTYGDTVALDGVDLAVRRGEVVALVGPNGAGKTTLVRCLTGTTRPDAGTVRLLGSAPSAADAERVGLLPQSYHPADRLTARELVRRYAGLYDGARDPDAVLAAVGLDPGDDTRYEALSGGQQRRACVATALVNDPDALFLDEPTTGIDPVGRRSVRDLVADLADDGTAVLLTTHDMDEAETLADRVALLADGDVVAAGPPGDVVAAHAGPSRIRIDTRDGGRGVAALDDAGLTARAVDGGLVVEDVDPTDVGTVVRTLDEAGIAFSAVAWSEPDLEDAYLALAGDETGEVEG